MVSGCGVATATGNEDVAPPQAENDVTLTGGSKPQSQVGIRFLDLNFNSRRQTKRSKFARHTSAIVNSSVLRHILTKRQRLRQEQLGIDLEKNYNFAHQPIAFVK